MRTSRFARPMFVFAAFLFVVSAFLLVNPPQVLGVQEGSVTYVSSSPNFYQKGGDCATQMLGNVQFKQTIFDSLLEADVNQEEIPALAKSWKVGPDWSYVDFFLRTDVKYHNGMPFKAEDVKYSLDKHMEKKNRWVLGVYFKRYIKSIDVLAPDHVRFVMNNPFWGLFGRLWWGTGIFPQAYREQVGDEGFAANPVGAGPFKWTGDWKQDQYVVLEAVPNHYRYTPAFKTLKIMFVPEHSTRLAMLKSGEGDIVSLHAPHRPEVQADPKFKLVTNYYASGSTLVYLDLAFPDKPSPFHDVRVRDAVSMAIDRKTICDKILFNAAKPWGSVLTPGTIGFNPKEAEPDKYDPERAKKLLAEAGYANGFDTNFAATAGNKYYVEAMIANLNAVGIRAKMQVWEGMALTEAFRNRKLTGFDIRISWYNAERHSSLYDGFMTGAINVYCGTKEIDAALDKAERALTMEDRIKTNEQLEQTIKKAKMRALLWTWAESWGLSPKIEYWQPKLGAAPSVSLEYVRLKKG
jgi:peptide/nickel transport system substrate-binding protein